MILLFCPVAAQTPPPPQARQMPLPRHSIRPQRVPVCRIRISHPRPPFNRSRATSLSVARVHASPFQLSSAKTLRQLLPHSSNRPAILPLLFRLQLLPHIKYKLASAVFVTSIAKAARTSLFACERLLRLPIPTNYTANSTRSDRERLVECTPPWRSTLANS